MLEILADESVGGNSPTVIINRGAKKMQWPFIGCGGLGFSKTAHFTCFDSMTQLCEEDIPCIHLPPQHRSVYKMSTENKMRAVVFHSPYKVAVEERPIPKIQDSGDIVVKVTYTALCGR